MLETPLPSPSVFTATSAYSLAGVAGIAVIATTAAGRLLPKDAPWQDRVTFIWLVRTCYQLTPILSFSGLFPLLTTTTVNLVFHNDYYDTRARAHPKNPTMCRCWIFTVNAATTPTSQLLKQRKKKPLKL